MTRPAALALLLALGPAAAAAQQPRVAEVQVAPHYLRIVVDAEAPLLATGYDVNGVPVDAEFRWQSSNINVAEVDDDGLVHAVAPGSTVITATTGSGSARRYGQVSVYVFRPRGAMVVIPPLPPDKSPGVHPPMPPEMPNMDSIIRASIDCDEPFVAAANPMRACYDRRPMMREHGRMALTPTEGQCPAHRGVVAMLLLVSETGTVTEVRQYAPSGCPALDSLASQRARATQFEPAQKHGHPVSAWVRFMLHVE